MITPSNFGCENVMELMDDYRRGKLEPHLLVLVGEHLQNCNACAAELRMRDAISGHLQTSLPAAVAPAALSPAVRRTIDQMSPAAAERKSAPLLPLMLSAAAVVMVAIAVVQLQTSPSIQRSTDLAAAKSRAAVLAGHADQAANHAEVQEAPAAEQTAAAAASAPAPSERVLFAETSRSAVSIHPSAARQRTTATAVTPTTASAVAESTPHTAQTTSSSAQTTSAPASAPSSLPNSAE